MAIGGKVSRGILMLVLGLAAGTQAVAQPVPTLPEQYLFATWQRGEGLPQNTAQAIVQDNDGYLWIGTQNGLVRFDGQRLEVFDERNTPELLSSYAETLAAGEGGELWIGTHRGLARFEDGHFDLLTAADGLAGDQVRVLQTSRDGGLWIGTLEGLQHWDGETFTSYTTRSGLPHNSVESLLEDRDGGLWIGTVDGLAYLANGRFTLYGVADGLRSTHVRALWQDRDGEVWMGTENGLHRFSGGRFEALPNRREGRPNGLVHPAVRALYDDAEGYLWIGTFRGLARYKDGVFTSYTAADGLPNNEIEALWEDHEGSLWVGTRQGGLARLRRADIVTVGEPEGLPGDSVWAVLQDHDQVVWLGTDDGLARLGPDGVPTAVPLAGGRGPEPVVRGLFEDRRGGIWIGTSDGAYLDRAGAVRAVPLEGRPRVNTIAEDDAGRIWMGTEGEGLYRLDGDAVRRFTARDGLADDRVRVLLPEAEGLWIGTQNGLSYLAGGGDGGGDGEGFVTYTTADGLGGNHVLALHRDGSGNLWIGSGAGGLTRLKDGRFDRFSSKDGLLSNDVLAIVEDDRGRLWISTLVGIFHVTREELDLYAAGLVDSLRPVVFTEAHGLRSVEANGGSQPSGWRGRDGRLWFPTSRGAAVIDPARLGANPVPPPVLIEEVVVDGQTLGSKREATVGPGAKVFEARYTALSFLEPERIRFRHLLEGFDDDWIDNGNRRFAHYTNLSPGTYRFRVKAANSDGVWNEKGDAFALEVRAAFYQTWPFYGFCVLALLFLGRGVHLLRVKSLLRHNRQLQKMKAEIETQHRELEAQHAEIQSKNEELERFTYTVSHDLKSPLFTIRGFLGLVEKDAEAGDVERLRTDLDHIRRATDKMGRLLEELLELSRIGRIVNPPQDVALGDVVAEALELVAGGIAERQVEVVVAPRMPRVKADRPRIVEVMQNLVENAVKYLGDQPSPRVEIGAREKDGEVLVWVRDNGMGIEPRFHEHVFSLFRKLDPASDGTGIGLALVERIVEVHGGRVWVESKGEGLGSTFYFTLATKRGNPSSGA